MMLVVAYDIASDDARAKSSAVLAGWGDRIQKSVYQCQVDSDEFEEIVERIEALIDPSTDVVQFFRLCAHCSDAQLGLGQSATLAADPYWIV